MIQKAKQEKETILALLDEEGPFFKSLPGYLPRKEQREMAADVIDAILEKKITLIEAETGLGKSLAYLLPALALAITQKKRIVIATKTIQLQEQLLSKEIPKIVATLGIEIKPFVLKGMSNYLCPKKVEELLEEPLLLEEEERTCLEKLLAAPPKQASRQELVFSERLKDKVFAESDHCIGAKCPHFEHCPVFLAKKEAETANLVIVNHALFFNDLKLRKDKESSPLANRDVIIFDEAHHVESVAVQQLADRLSLLSLLKNLGRLSSDRARGKLFILKERIASASKIPKNERASLLQRLHILIPTTEKELFYAIDELFHLEDDNEKIALDAAFSKTALFKEALLPKIQLLIKALLELALALFELEEEMKKRLEETTLGKLLPLLNEIGIISHRLESAASLLTSIITMPPPVTSARWMERTNREGRRDLVFVEAQLDLGSLLHSFLFECYPSIVLTSATLTSNQGFSVLRKRLGLHENLRVVEKKYLSPFDYEKNVLFFVPSELPLPEDPAFSSEALSFIHKMIGTTKGGTLILFTSYEMMNHFFENSLSFLKKKGYPVFLQGEGKKALLIEEFQKNQHSVLFGTDTFWEGVDIRNKALRSVILIKLPFKVPSDPLTQAQYALAESRKQSPFIEITLPDAVMKFKQGFGRLMRSPEDRGIILCLDKRLYTKNYGKSFLSALPTCEKLFLDSNGIQGKVDNFFSSTRRPSILSESLSPHSTNSSF